MHGSKLRKKWGVLLVTPRRKWSPSWVLIGEKKAEIKKAVLQVQELKIFINLDTEESQQSPHASDVFEDNASASSTSAEPTGSISSTQAEQTGLASSTQAEPSECYINQEGPPPPLEEQRTSETSTSTQASTRSKRRNNPKPQPQEDTANIMLAEALECLPKSTDDTLDPHYSFGRHIANELRKYDTHTLECVKNAIDNIIFEADMGKYTQQYSQGYFTQQYPQASTSTLTYAASSPTTTTSSIATTASQFEL